MTVQETKIIRDALWTEIRQFVLNEGPAVELLDKHLAAHPEFPMEEREAFIATLIAERCAEIAAMAEGPFNSMPVAIVLGSWAGRSMANEMEEAGKLS